MLKMSILFSSQQIQFPLIQFITRLIVSDIIDYKYIEPKIEPTHNPPLKNISWKEFKAKQKD